MRLQIHRKELCDRAVFRISRTLAILSSAQVQGLQRKAKGLLWLLLSVGQTGRGVLVQVLVLVHWSWSLQRSAEHRLAAAARKGPAQRERQAMVCKQGARPQEQAQVLPQAQLSLVAKQQESRIQGKI